MGLGTFVKHHLTDSGGGDLVPAVPASTPGQKPSQRQIYQNRFNHGPNLGAMFVLEKWISGDDLFKGTDKGSELEAVKATVHSDGVEGARQKFENHWTNWLDERNDWDWLKSKGVTGIRVPIGYWMVNNGEFTRHTPFEKYKDVYKNSWTIFKSHVVARAAQRQIAVLVDLHGVPGGANGEDHSGTSSGKAEFWSSSNNIELAVQVVKFIAQDLISENNISGIQIINEAPYVDNAKTHMKAYYLRALSAIRSVYADIPVVISDAWNSSAFISFISEQENKISTPSKPQTLGLVIDTHIYKCFSESDRSKSPQQLIADVDGSIPQTDEVDLLVGEYSCVMDERTWKQLPGGQSKDQVVLDYGRRQINHFLQRAKTGNYFWTYKFRWGSGGEWGFREMTDKGALPDYSLVKSHSAEEYSQAFEQRLNNAKNSHVNYWQSQNPDRDWQHWRFEDGFTTGWNDAQAFDEFDHSEIGRIVAWRKSREAQHIQAKGYDELIWVFRHGFDQGVHQFLEARYQ